MRDPKGKLMTLEEALEWRRVVAEAGHLTAVTNGCFDLLHRGHVEYLNRARAEADVLLVLVNTDASIEKVKGAGRPIVRQDDRVYMLASLESVDGVVLFDTEHCTDLLEKLTPDVYVKGGDYTEETLVQEEFRLLKRMGCRIALLGFVDGMSTTDIIRRIREGEEKT
ncbi:MAG: adenylyltransferase/cytidyltransferase family protein [Candidatus Pacebacteria bacterium]|nr:adenylyltransferase/cytidyltransferase family protein [Candidatus Paceibacterota bacterium]